MAALVAGLMIGISHYSLVQAEEPPPFNHEARITAPDREVDDQFASWVAIDGDTMVVSAFWNDDNGTDSGSVYIYSLINTEWVLQQKLTAPDASEGDWFGRTVAISGDTVVVGANRDLDESGFVSGSVYIYVRNGVNWTLQEKIKPDDISPGDIFGTFVAIDGDTIVASSRWDDDDGNNSGSVYVFERSGTNWSQEAKLIASDAGAYDEFGTGLDIDGNTLVVNTYKSGRDNTYPRYTYIFARGAEGWVEEVKLPVPCTGARVDGDTVIAGASNSIFIFERSGSEWSQKEEITAPDIATDGQYFGTGRAIDANTMVIGAPYYDEGSGNFYASAYVYIRSGTSWLQHTRLTAPALAVGYAAHIDAVVASNFVAVSGDTVAIGVGFADGRRGAVYVFTIDPTDRDGDGVDDDDDLFPDDPNRSNIIDHIEYIIDYVSDDEVIFDSDWKNKRMRDAFIPKLEAVLEIVVAAEAAEDPELAAALVPASCRESGQRLDRLN